MKYNVIWSLVLIIVSAASASRVLEVGDKFIDMSQEGQWLVKFYAPWCAHCQRMEPVWAHVAQALYNTPVRVAKADCTRFVGLGKHFKVGGFPTIMFIKNGEMHTYEGERLKEDLVQYALRMSQPAVQHVSRDDSMQGLTDTTDVFFGYVGERSGPLWNIYFHHANKFRSEVSFFSMSHDVVKQNNLLKKNGAIFVYKDNETALFEDQSILEDADKLNSTLERWINEERFGTFPKVTRSNIHQLMATGKYLVLAVVAENKLMQITDEEKDFKDMIEGIIRKNKKELHANFQFGWIGSPDLSHSITMSSLATPHLVVLNSNTSHHHLPQDDAREMTAEAVRSFLDQVYAQVAPTYGGKSLPTRIYRFLFEAKTTVVEMWRGNPVLTCLVFGLPLGFLSLICYSIFCADILVLEDDEPESNEHEKKD